MWKDREREGKRGREVLKKDFASESLLIDSAQMQKLPSMQGNDGMKGTGSIAFQLIMYFWVLTTAFLEPGAKFAYICMVII
jgi:hypothetical protein